MYYFSKHPELNNFLQPKETQQHTKRWGFLLWEEDGLRAALGRRQDVQNSFKCHLSISQIHQDLEPIFVKYNCPFL